MMRFVDPVGWSGWTLLDLEPGGGPGGTISTSATSGRAAGQAEAVLSGRDGGPLRLLVVEDSFMTARLLVRMVEDLGGRVIGPAPSVSRAMAFLDEFDCDGAILDINLGNESVEPVARRLADAGRPFIFVSGYATPHFVDEHFKSRRLLHKPVDPYAFKQALTDTFSQ